MSFLIRLYRESDAPAILDIINDSILNTSHNYDYEPKTLGEVILLFQEKNKGRISDFGCGARCRCGRLCDFWKI